MEVDSEHTDAARGIQQSNRSEAHVLDVVKLSNQTLPRASTVDSSIGITGSRRRLICTRKTICKNLVDGARAPLSRCGSKASYSKSKVDKDMELHRSGIDRTDGWKQRSKIVTHRQDEGRDI